MAERCAEQYNVEHISTGNIFREHIKQETELGKQVSAILKGGGLVPDALTVALVKEYLNNLDEAGYILDGFPRTIAQADALAGFAEIDSVVLFSLAHEKIIERLSGRRIHPASGRVYHLLFNPPQEANKDDVTGEALVQREDDREEAIRNRLSVYEKETAPLIDYYRARAMLVEIDASPVPDAVFAALCGELEA